MAGVITRGVNPKLMWPGLNTIYGLTYNEYSPQWKELFPTSYMSDKAYEEDVSMTGVGLAPVKPEGDAFSYDTMKQAYTSRYTHVAYSIGYIISYEETRDNQYSQVGPQRTRNVAFSMHQTKERIAADIYNRAFNSSYTGGDGVSFINSSHPTEGGTLSNDATVAANLSEYALEQMIIQIQQIRDNRNNLISVMPDALIVPPAQQFEATRIMRNPDRPGTADRDINAIYTLGMLPGGVKVNQFLTSTTAWFIRTNCPDGLKHFQREAPIFRNDNDFPTMNARFSGYERYSFGWTDWRGLFGNEGV